MLKVISCFWRLDLFTVSLALRKLSEDCPRCVMFLYFRNGVLSSMRSRYAVVCSENRRQYERQQSSGPAGTHPVPRISLGPPPPTQRPVPHSGSAPPRMFRGAAWDTRHRKDEKGRWPSRIDGSESLRLRSNNLREARVPPSLLARKSGLVSFHISCGDWIHQPLQDGTLAKGGLYGVMVTVLVPCPLNTWSHRCLYTRE